jgi:iron complex outermembrane recepter protein
MSVRYPAIRRTGLALAMLAAFYGPAALAAGADDVATPAPAVPATVPTTAPPSTVDTTNDVKNLEAVSVVATGETRQIQKVTIEDIKALPPGSSPLKAIDQLPGVQFQSSDPWGAYEWSTQITLHGFDQSRLGFTLDDIPLGNAGYAVTNGLQITRAITSDNISTVELAQGAGALGTPSNSNLGGTIRFFSADPENKAGAQLSQTLGSDSTNRTYLRLDTGDFHGFSMYVSYAAADTDKWKGFGDQKSDQLNLKTLYQWGDGNRVSLFFDSSKRKEYDYQDLSLTSQRVLGWNYDYLQPDWGQAVQIANAINGKGPYPASLNGLPANYDKGDVNYYAGGGIRKDNLVGLSSAFNLGGATLNVGSYYHDDRGEGQWATPYQASSPTVPISMRTTDYGLDRYGLTSSLQFTIGDNEIEVGGWGENAKDNQERNYFYLSGPYTNLTNFYSSDDPFLRGYYQSYSTRTRMGYAEDTLHFLDNQLTVNFGAKSLSTTTTAESLVVSSATAAGTMKASKGFLPQAGIDYKIDSQQDVYASYSKNLAAYGILPFTTSQAAFDASKNTLHPEESQNYELGYRVRTGNIEASADLYYTRFSNRLLAVSPCSAVETCAASLNNVGSVKSKGVDLAVIWKPIEQIRWLNSLSYDNSKYEDNYLDDGVVHTAGKYVVGVPKTMFTSSMTYTAGPWSLNAESKYTGRRYITYTDDSAVPSYWMFNAGANYDVGKVGLLEDLSFGANVTNIANKHYFASTGTNGYVASDPNGYNQTLQAGAPRQFFINVNMKL